MEARGDAEARRETARRRESSSCDSERMPWQSSSRRYLSGRSGTPARLRSTPLSLYASRPLAPTPLPSTPHNADIFAISSLTTAMAFWFWTTLQFSGKLGEMVMSVGWLKKISAFTPRR